MFGALDEMGDPFAASTYLNLSGNISSDRAIEVVSDTSITVANTGVKIQR